MVNNRCLGTTVSGQPLRDSNLYLDQKPDAAAVRFLYFIRLSQQTNKDQLVTIPSQSSITALRFSTGVLI